MAKIVVLILGMLVVFIAKASDNQPLWFQYSDQLVLKFHLSSLKQFPPAENLISDLKNSSPDFEDLINSYKKERDAFRKNELLNEISEKFYNMALPDSNGNIAFFSRIYVGEYDFQRKGFELCFNKNCEARPGKVSNKFGAKKYELLVSNVDASIFISPDEAVAKRIESLASKTTGWNYRSLPAVVIVQPTGTDDSKKWSDGSSYNVLKTSLVGLYVLNDGKFNRKKFPNIKEIATYFEYKK